MIIHRIRLKDYRGVDSAEAAFLPQGVTVIEGPNESGKSCFAEALDVVLDDLDSSSKERIRAIQPVHRDVGPEIEVDIETGPYRFVLLKRYLKNNKTELTVLKPKPQSLTGREAHERVRQMLEETLDIALWKALRVIQGGAVGQVEVPSKSTLTVALDRAAGGNPAGEQEATLFEAVEQEYGTYYTPSGRERDIIKSAAAKVDTLRTRVQELQGTMQKIEADIKRSEDLARELKRLSDSESSQKKSLQEWEGRHLAVETSQHSLQIARTELELAARNQTQLAENAAARSGLSLDLKNAGERIKELEQELSTAVSALEAAKSEYEDSKAEIRAAEKEVSEAFETLQLRQKDFEYLGTRFDLALLKERRDRYAKALQDAEEAERLLASNKVDEKALERLRSANQAVQIARARLEQGGPAVKLEPLGELVLNLDREKLTLKKGQVVERQVSDTLDISIDTVVNIHVRPGTSTDSLRQDFGKAEKKLREQLDSLGIEDFSGALEAHRAHEAAAKVLAELGETRKRDLRDLTYEQMQAKVLELEGRIASHEASRPKEPPIPENREASKRLVKQAELTYRSASERMKAIQSRLDGAARVWEEMTRRHVERETRLQEVRASAEDLQERLHTLRKQVTDDDLARGIQEAANKRAEKQGSVLQLEMELRKLDPDTVETRYENARKLHEKVQKEREEVERAWTEVSARLRVFEEEGVFDALQSALAGLDHSEQEYKSITKRAEAARLLLETFTQVRQIARLNYVKPLKEAVERFGRIVYGESFQVDIGQDLQINSRTLDGRTVPFTSLSTGTQEQLSLIFRLASASIAGKEGNGVPLIIDDALGYSDPDRVQSMGAVLDAAARNSQVIAMTCTPERYHYISGARIVRLA